MDRNQLEDAASVASQQAEISGTEMVKVSVVGINGEWLEEQPSLGETVKLEIVGFVRRVGTEALEGGDGGVREFAQIKVTGVKRIG